MSASRFTRREFLRIAGLTGIGAVAAACAPSAAPTSSPPAATTLAPTVAPTRGPQYGGVMKIIASGGSPVVFGYPPAVMGTDYPASLPALETLTRLDKTGGINPFLATAWEVSQDGKSVTYTLRKGVKFHDGTEFNADAAKYNLDARKAGGTSELAKVTSVDVLDPYSIRLNLSQHDNSLLNSLCMSAGLMASPTAIKTNGADWAKTHPVGTGPFKYEDFKRDVYLKYAKFEDYWDKGKPYLDGLQYIYVADDTTAMMSFQSGQGNVFTGQPKSASDLAKTLGDKVKVSYYRAGLQFLLGDSANADSALADKRVRQAVEYAIDRPAIAKTLGYGYWEAANQIVPSHITGYDPNIVGRPFDPNKAKQLLSEAGFAGGLKTKIITRSTSGEQMTAIQGYLSAVGIDATIDLADPGRFSSTQNGGWKNALFNGQVGVDPNYAETLIRQLSSASVYWPSVRRSPEFQKALEDAAETRDVDTRKTLIQKVAKIADDDAMVVPLWSSATIAVMDQSVNCDLYVIHHMVWHPADAWIAKSV